MKKLIIANWKMNPDTVAEARSLLLPIEHKMHLIEKNVDVCVCPPAVFLAPLNHTSHKVTLGAQNVSWLDSGALTGEISSAQLKQWKVKYVIIGHSERRIYLGETDEMVSKKIIQVLKARLIPVVCLGGDKDAQENEMKPLVTKQLNAAIKDLDRKQIEKLIFAYEPTWAISTTKNSKPETGEHTTELILHIQELLSYHVGHTQAKNMKILYGGTVNKNNVHEYAKHPQIDGALVGAASLDPENFWEVLKEFSRESVHK